MRDKKLQFANISLFLAKSLILCKNVAKNIGHL